MNEQSKLIWLKRILFAKVVITFLVWGLPALFGTKWLLGLLNLSMPEDPMYLRLFGAAVTAFGVAYWFAYRDPIQNRAILQAGIVDNGLITLTVVYLALSRGIESWFVLISAFLTGFFCIAFIGLMPSRELEVLEVKELGVNS
jgi:hypothetical protein